MSQTTVFTQIEESFSPETGEIKNQRSYTVKKSQIAPTDEYIKVSKYLSVIFAYHNIPLKLLGISMIIAQNMEWKTNMVYLLKGDKVKIGEMLGLSTRYKTNPKTGKQTEDTNTVDKLIRECIKYDIIRRTNDRGKFEVNSFLFSTGTVAETRNLQVLFDIDADTIRAQGKQTNLITGETVLKAVSNSKKKDKQIPGQMSIEDMGVTSFE